MTQKIEEKFGTENRIRKAESAWPHSYWDWYRSFILRAVSNSCFDAGLL